MTNSLRERIQNKQRSSIEQMIAVVLLIAITIVTGVVVYSLFTSTSNTNAASSYIEVTNAQLVQNGETSTIFSLTIKNSGTSPITTFITTVADPTTFCSSTNLASNCTGGGVNSTLSQAIPVGEVASVEGTVTNVPTIPSYTASLSVKYDNGQTAIKEVVVATTLSTGAFPSSTTATSSTLYSNILSLYWNSGTSMSENFNIAVGGSQSGTSTLHSVAKVLLQQLE